MARSTSPAPCSKTSGFDDAERCPVTSVYLGVLSASLLGSVHCAGMCGGLVPLYAGQAGRAPYARHVAYNAGRLLAYFSLGLLAGALGKLVDMAGALGGGQRVASWVAGGVIVLWGSIALAGELGWKAWTPSIPGVVRRTLSRGMRLAAAVPPLPRAVAVGLLSALLPCGWLWAFVITAAGTGTATSGGLVMFAFWIGTLPMMLGVGALMGLLSAPLRRKLPLATAVVMIALGLITVVRRAPIAIAAPPSDEPTAAVPADPPCHGRH